VARADGSYLWVEAGSANLLDRPGISGIVISVRDISERRRTVAALGAAQERFRTAFAGAPIGMLLSDLGGRLVEVNDAFATMMGRDAGALVGTTLGELTLAEDRALAAGAFARLRAGMERVQGEWRLVRYDRRLMWAAVSQSVVVEADGSPLVISQVEDVTQRKAIAERLEYTARHDDVTTLYNRSYFMDRLERALRGLYGGGERVAVIFLDLDRFKVVNDSLGHAAGDQLLRVVAGRIRRAVRASDVVARFGGDEFTALLVDAGDDEVMRVANRIAATIAEPVPLTDGDTYVSASIGVAVADRPGSSADAILRDADAAMYRAKERGRNRIERFDAASRATAVSRHRTANDLHRALQRGELSVAYQPVVALESGLLSGFEALVRWEHPERGPVPPAEWVDLAEDTGLIIPVGFAVMREAFGQVATWQRAGGGAGGGDAGGHGHARGLKISVNLSARQLSSADLVPTVSEIITESGIDPDSVWLEITESALMTDAKSASVTLRSLRGLGVHLAVDDFGTGYASLTYLQRFPVEGLKIDRSFVDGLGIEASDTTIVDTLIHLGHSLGLTVVAEGLETPLQLTHLRRLGCDHAQGFLFSAAQPAPVLTEQLGAWLDAPVR
jgi:diguanylate cyclase (GGDEF)-like protein/PAS domain S-box-containing protein